MYAGSWDLMFFLFEKHKIAQGALASLLALMLTGVGGRSALAAPAAALTAAPTATAHAQHVLLISIDGLHQQDLSRYVTSHPDSTLAELSRYGIRYTHAYTPVPSDSFPGTVALISGATPQTSGIYYDDSYDRKLSPAGSKCNKEGASVVFDDSIDRDASQLDGGGAIDPAHLPLDRAHGCKPVYPHDFIRVNTAFEVIKQAGGYTAWVDKHPAYDFVNGPSGSGVDDLYTPEIAAMGEKIAAFPAYDDLKVQAVLNQIAGHHSSGGGQAPVPTLFGMNFQNLSVAQKSGDGYRDAQATSGHAVDEAMHHIDDALGRIVAALQAHQLAQSTLLVITAKHGQSPIDPTRIRRIDGHVLTQMVDGVAPHLLAKSALDDVGLLWLSDARQTQVVAAVLRAHATELGIARVYAGNDMPAGFALAAIDSRAPDLAIETIPGVIYTHGKKIAEHGGFAEDDRHVALLLSRPDLPASVIDTPVGTTQVAPTMLAALGLNPQALKAVQIEHTQALPGLIFVGRQ